MNDKIQEIKNDIATHHIVLFMKGEKEQPQCRFSMDVVKALRACGADFVTRNILEDEELRTAIKEFSHWPTLPQLYVGGTFIGGRDIILDLHDSGELAGMVS